MTSDVDPRVQLCSQQILKLDIKVKSGITKLESDEFHGSEAELTRYSQALREKSSLIDDKINELAGLAREQKVAQRSNDILKDIERHRQAQLDNLYRLRSAVVSAMKGLESRSRSELFSGGEVRLRSAAPNSQLMMDQSAKVTNSLGSLLGQMSSQVKASEATLGALITSSEVIGETHEEFHSMTGQIHTSNKLLSKYARREMTDRFLLALAMLLYLCTCFYIVRKRLFG